LQLFHWCSPLAICSFPRRSRDKSLLLIPHVWLNLIWTEISKGIQSDPQQVQWATTRRWNDNVNSMQTLLYVLAQSGEHLLFW
jgi:hypothetical protein